MFALLLTKDIIGCTWELYCVLNHLLRLENLFKKKEKDCKLFTSSILKLYSILNFCRYASAIERNPEDYDALYNWALVLQV